MFERPSSRQSQERMAGRCPLHSDPSVTVSIIRAKNTESIHNCLRVFACKFTSKPHKLLSPPQAQALHPRKTQGTSKSWKSFTHPGYNASSGSCVKEGHWSSKNALQHLEVKALGCSYPNKSDRESTHQSTEQAPE